jgi:hypothetical protein
MLNRQKRNNPMPRARNLRRLAVRFAVVLPFAAGLQAACGGSDTIPFDSDAATPVDGSGAMDGSMIDGAFDDSTVGDGAMSDGAMSDGTVNDGTVSDSSNDGSSNDGTLADAADAGDAADALDAADANDAFDAADGNVSVTQIDLGRAVNFAVFGHSTVTNANITTVTGDIGTFSTTIPPIGTTAPILVGAYHLGDIPAQNAATDILIAYDNLMPAALPGCAALTGQDLGGKTLPPGVYCFSTSAQLTGALVLDSGGDPNAQWVFQIGSTLTTAPGASVTVVGASPCNVAWQVGSSATIDTNTAFSGNILASASITLNTGSTLAGRALTVVGAVTMDTNVVSIALCPAAPPVDAGLPDASDAGDAD